MTRRLLSLVLPALMAASAAAAQAPPSSENCLPYDGAYARAPLMQVSSRSGVRAFLQDKPRPCPTTTACAWRHKAYLTDGDVVLAGQLRAGFRCVYYGSPKGRLTAGFIAAAFLKPTTEATVADSGFLTGKWREDGGAAIDIKTAGAGLKASGDASYRANQGGFDGPLTPTADGFTVADEDCLVTARRRGPYLAVSDNGECGGADVSFAGLYMKRK